MKVYAKNNAPINVELKKVDPKPQQIQLKLGNYAVSSLKFQLNANETWFLPIIITGDVTTNGDERAIIIVNRSDHPIKLGK